MNDIDNMNKNCGAAEVFGELTFEQAASKLEEIVEKLDSGETPLGETVKLYEPGNRALGLLHETACGL